MANFEFWAIILIFAVILLFVVAIWYETVYGRKGEKMPWFLWLLVGLVFLLIIFASILYALDSIKYVNPTCITVFEKECSRICYSPKCDSDCDSDCNSQICESIVYKEKLCFEKSSAPGGQVSNPDFLDGINDDLY